MTVSGALPDSVAMEDRDAENEVLSSLLQQLHASHIGHASQKPDLYSSLATKSLHYLVRTSIPQLGDAIVLELGVGSASIAGGHHMGPGLGRPKKEKDPCAIGLGQRCEGNCARLPELHARPCEW